MPYVVMVIALGIVLNLWWQHRDANALHQLKMAAGIPGYDNRRQVRETRNRAVIGTVIGAFAIWIYGVQPLQEEAQQRQVETNWFATYASKHQQAWQDTCNYIFTSNGANGVLYRDGQAFSEAWCNSLWRAPQIPDEYSTSQFDQPESARPFASEAVFGPSALTYSYCASPYDVESCFGWDDIIQPPSYEADYGW